MKNLAFKKISHNDKSDELSSTREYVFDFLQTTHPSRSGEICPMVNKLLNQNTLFIGVANDSTEIQIQESIEIALQYQLTIKQELSSTIIVFNSDSIWSLLNKLHVKNLLRIMDHGFILGVFGPESNVPSVHNDNFFPNRSPKNMLVIRTMVPHDLKFFTNIQSKRRRLLAYQAFAKKFPDNKDVKHLMEDLRNKKYFLFF